MDENEGEEKLPIKPDKKAQNDKKSRCINRSFWVAFLSVLVAVCSVFVYLTDFTEILQYYTQSTSFYQEYHDDKVDPEIINLFMSYDANLDGKIDPKEFVPIAKRIFSSQVLISVNITISMIIV